MSKDTKVTAEITSIEKNTVIKTGERFLDATIELRDGKEVVTYKRGFQVNTTKDELKDALVKLVDDYVLSKERAGAQAELDALEAQANKTIEEAAGLKV